MASEGPATCAISITRWWWWWGGGGGGGGVVKMIPRIDKKLVGYIKG